MKIAFLASLYQKEQHQFHYLAIIELLEELGHQVLHQHFTNFTLEQISQSDEQNQQCREQFQQALNEAEAIVMETSCQSLGLGYILAEALKQQKPILMLTTEKEPPLSVFLDDHEQIVVYRYTKIRELEEELPFLLEDLPQKKDKKFNVFLPLELDRYLLNAAQNKRLSKSEYLRQLLKKDKSQHL